jgi:hypothetical protein
MFHVITLVNFLQDAGHTVRVVCVEPSDEEVAGLREAIHVTGLAVGNRSGFAGKLKQRLCGGNRLRRYLKRQAFDLLYVIDSWTLPTLWLATFSRLGWRGARLVYHTFD